MFNFLKKKDQKSRIVIIAKQAIIDTVYEQGKISGFFIILQKDGKEFISKLKGTDLLSNFIEVIEERIKNNDYKDATSRLLEEFLVEDTTRKDNVSKVKRIVSESNYLPIFHWTPPTLHQS